MATAKKIEKMLEVKLNDSLELVEESVECITGVFYILSAAKGTLKFAYTEEACNAYFAKQKELADVKAAAKAKAAAQKAAMDKELKSETPVEDTKADVSNEELKTEATAEDTKVNVSAEETKAETIVEDTKSDVSTEETKTEATAEETEDHAIQLAIKHGLTEVKPPVVPRYFVDVAGTQYMWLPKSKVYMSVAPMTDKQANAHRGKEPDILRRSPKKYEELAASVGATIPTKEQLVEFAVILVAATNSADVDGVKAVIPDIRLDNQLCIDGTVYTTLLGEQRNLYPTDSVFNLECRKVLA